MQRSSSSTPVSAARWLVGVIAGVVLSFVLATLVTQGRERAIAHRADDIIGNAMPSVERLSVARGDLRALENALDDYARVPADERGPVRDRIEALRQDMEAAIASYQSLPFFPSERALYAHVADDRRRLDAQVDRLFGAAEPGALAELHHALDAVDASLERVVTFDAAQGQRLGREIESIHAQATALITLLDAISVALAIAAGVLAVRQLRRMTRAEEAERAERERRERDLASENEALGQFAGRVAHDVLSPLSAAELALEIVRRAHAQDPAAQRATDRGVRAIHRVHTLVEDLLAFSRAGGRPEPGASAELAPLIGELVADLASQADQHGIALVVGPVPAGAIACSPGVLTSVISNLVRNAIKYMGDATERRIDLRVAAAGERWRVEVEDTGPGIPAEQQQRIFEPYVQLQRGAPGIGLGLATVERLVRAHGGAVGVRSSGRGALFWFELPVATPPPSAARAPGSRAAV